MPRSIKLDRSLAGGEVGIPVSKPTRRHHRTPERGDALLAGLLRSRRCGRPQSQNWCVVSAETGGVPCDFLTASPPAGKPAARED
jgi:hypothetical protein